VAGRARRFDSLHMGRCGLDLYSNDIGAPFTEITSFAAYVGGSPTNICVGAQRLGLRTALLTAVGEDLTGDFVLAYLQREGVETAFAPRKPGFRTGAALLAIEPPDRFPLVYYRENVADAQLDLDDVAAAPIADSRLLQLAGTNLSREPAATATRAAAEIARAAQTDVVLDLDLRADLWPDPRAFGIAVRALLPLVDVVIGTDDEINAAVLTRAEHLRVEHGQVTEAHVAGDTDAAIETLLALGPGLLVRKRGAQGASVYRARPGGPAQRDDVPGFPIEVVNVLGAGDAFAAGFIYGYLEGWEPARAVRLGNAAGALVATRHGCSASMPTLGELQALIADNEGAATAAHTN
jgi:5-dehydro-2-deoxygluconokinase